MSTRAFPVIFATSPSATARFYELLGFAKHYQLPPDSDDPGYIGLRRDSTEVAVVSITWPTDNYGLTPSTGVRFEMFVYVSNVDKTTEQVAADGSQILRPPTDMSWGERVAYVTDPDGNPVALASTND